MYFGKQKAIPYDFIVIQKGSVDQQVSVTGRIKPAKSLGFAFEKSGKVNQVNVQVGDKITEGTQLAILEDTDTSAQVAQAQAGIDFALAQAKQAKAGAEAQRAKLMELARGMRPEERQLAQTKVNAARQALFNAERNLQNTESKATLDVDNLYADIKTALNDAYLKSYDAVKRQADSDYQQAEVDAEWFRIAADDALSQFKNDINNLPYDSYGLDDALVRAQSRLATIQSYLSRLNDALDASLNGSLVASTLNTYRGNLNTSRTTINAAIASLEKQRQVIATQKTVNQSTTTTAESRIDDARNALIAAEDEFRLKNAGASAEQIAAQTAAVNQSIAGIEAQVAQVRQAQANLKNVKSQAGKTIVSSTVSGVVTRVEADPGEVVSPNTPVVFVITDAEFKLEAQIAEADIAKIKVGDPARVTLDAYGEDVVFQAEVLAIDPAETMIEGVATYKTTLRLAVQDSRIKSGMTANIDIMTNKRDAVVSVPQRAVISKNGKKIVRVLDEQNNMSEVEVATGLRGSDGNIEITSGVKEGDKVVVFVKE